MHFKYCPFCGEKLIDKQAGDDGNVPFCIKCDRYWFDIFPTCTIVLIANEFNEIALLKQLYLSDKYLTFVAGYMQPKETAEQCIVREAMEEIGVDISTNVKYSGSYWFDSKGLLMIGFIARVKKTKFKLSNEVDDAKWVAAADVPKYLFPKTPENAAFKIYELFMEQIQPSFN